MSDLIKRQQAIDALTDRSYQSAKKDGVDSSLWEGIMIARRIIKNLPPVQPEKEIPKRVLWSGWKGVRDTRYKCPNCKKPVRNTDIYCHRCGQKLMFPNIDFTPYAEGKKQELIVRWDDE